MYYRNASCGLVAFDITNRMTFDRAIEWLKELKADPTPKVLVLAANKADLKESSVIAESEAQAVANEHGIRLFNTSAKTGQGIDEMFDYIVKELPKLERNDVDGIIRPEERGEEESAGRCPC